MIGGVPVALAYCTLCGSGILYETKVEGHKKPLIFGSSGFLYRSNKLMFDRETDSLWNQFTGEPVVGPLAKSGIHLKVRPVTITTWAKWQAENPNTKVLNMGDLNDNPTDVSMTKVLGCVSKKEKCKPGGLFNPWVDFYNKGIGTLGYNDSWSLFDQNVLSYGWLTHNQSGYFYQGAHIFSKDFMITKTGKYKGYPKRTWDFNIYNAGYSDHFPTYLILLKEVK